MACGNACGAPHNLHGLALECVRTPSANFTFHLLSTFSTMIPSSRTASECHGLAPRERAHSRPKAPTATPETTSPMEKRTQGGISR
eukprot:CAMPEP_0182828878 /NCGR_PEP_ID=MMETSP0006_2-20121128/17714_1 /TAXON_ID=97485 /ORGANISM="Prymnesium parvum, Strain Texoma1" /LENGTH=85 /DNA_ID=CAMNT_0024956283 /DNA_START=362 /DNA_END=615 /DNA_ORIENTATION=-